MVKKVENKGSAIHMSKSIDCTCHLPVLPNYLDNIGWLPASKAFLRFTNTHSVRMPESISTYLIGIYNLHSWRSGFSLAGPMAIHTPHSDPFKHARVNKYTYKIIEMEDTICLLCYQTFIHLRDTWSQKIDKKKVQENSVIAEGNHNAS